MSTESHDNSASARKMESEILQRLVSEGQRPVAEALGVHESTLSRMKSEGDLERFCRLLEQLGLKVVDQGVLEWTEDDLRSVSILAQRYLSGVTGIREEKEDWGADDHE